MNSLKQIADLNNKLQTVMEQNKGVVTITFDNKKAVQVRVLSCDTNYDFNSMTYKSTIRTFTNDINVVTEYDMATIKDLN